MVNYSDVLIKCGCGYTASEWEFATHEENEPLKCPECGDISSLEDAEV